MDLNIIFIGDIIGAPGRRFTGKCLRYLRDNEPTALVIANAENAAAGKGITRKTAQEVFEAGVDVITLGNHVWKWREIYTYLDENDNIIRPANYSSHAPGRGFCVINDRFGNRAGVINLSGRVFMEPAECPFRSAEEIINNNKVDYWIVDIHAEATSEKNALGVYLDGRVAAVVGTHTHIQTADERILGQGTAYITDAGMTGSHCSILGMDTKNVLKKFLTGMPHQFVVAKKDVQFRAVRIVLDNKSFKPVSINRLKISEEEI